MKTRLINIFSGFGFAKKLMTFTAPKGKEGVTENKKLTIFLLSFSHVKKNITGTIEVEPAYFFHFKVAPVYNSTC